MGGTIDERDLTKAITTEGFADVAQQVIDANNAHLARVYAKRARPHPTHAKAKLLALGAVLNDERLRQGKSWAALGLTTTFAKRVRLGKMSLHGLVQLADALGCHVTMVVGRNTGGPYEQGPLVNELASVGDPGPRLPFEEPVDG